MLSAVVASYPRNVPDLLIATDSPSVYTDVRAAIEEPGTTIRWARSGQAVLPALQERVADLVISDLQIGTMGGLAIAMQVTLEGAAGRLEKPVPMVILLDRRPDTFLAKRTGVAGWILKPLDPLRVRAAVQAVLAGGTYYDKTLAPAFPDVLPA
jgi:two-component system, OmpR family, response regulator BaeR